MVTFEMWEVEEHSVVSDKASTGLSILSAAFDLGSHLHGRLLAQNVIEVRETGFHQAPRMHHATPPLSSSDHLRLTLA